MKEERIQILIFYIDSTFCGEKTHNFSDTQVFLQQITKSVIRCVFI